MITPVKLIRKIRKKEAFTLAEVIIAAGLFTVISTLCGIVFINVMRAQRRLSIENALYEDARFMMERISREIRQNTIDYEEYYNRKDTNGATMPYYGQYYGCYSDRFYNPGQMPGELNNNGPEFSPAGQPSGLGAYCSDNVKPVQDSPGCIVNRLTLDINTGMNPYSGNSFVDKTPQAANAFCDKKFQSSPPPCQDSSRANVDELYLIDPTGTEKTIIVKKQVKATPNEFSVGLLRLNGKDLNPVDGIAEEWISFGPTGAITSFNCAPGFDCPVSLGNLDNSKDASITSLFQGFVPITPLRSTVKSLDFFVAPMEDPRKAFAETKGADAIQQQPHVTVVLTLEPASSQLTNYGSQDLPSITLQSTISSRVFSEVKSYDGRARCKQYN
ncbi:type II secretion system protein [Candidatus Gracilibacteria bacterium]|nr:type II secretion system protein [Candidatus Gracilibacteria bacterium]